MRVHVPPRMDAKERGMKSCDGAMPHFFDHFWRMGIMMATTGVLLRNAETKATGTMRRTWALATVLGVPRSLLM